MKQPPISNPFDDEEAYTRNFRLAILGFGLLLCLGISALGLMRNQTEFISLFERYFPTPTVTPTPAPTLTATRTLTPTATFTPTPNLTATQSAFISTSTAIAFRSTTTALADQWQEILSEPFDNNTNNWYTAAQEDDEYSISTFEIKDGKYRLSVLSHKGFIRWVPVSTNTLEDFSLTIEAKVVENSDANDYGIAFRVDSEGNFYYFAIDSDHLYSLYKFQGAEWTTLIDPAETPLIKKEGPNRLTVLAQGAHFILLINDQFVADEDDDSIKKGTTALAFEIYQPDQQATFEFDNIVLRSP